MYFIIFLDTENISFGEKIKSLISNIEEDPSSVKNPHPRDIIIGMLEMHYYQPKEGYTLKQQLAARLD